MKDDPSQEQSLQTWIDLFSDPASSLSTFLEKESGPESTLSSPLYLALWLDFFLVTGAKPVKEKWSFLSFAKQIELGIELLKYYLYQPLYIRLTKESTVSVIKAPLKLESQGKLFRVEQGTGTNRKIELLYPLDHPRFWPDLFGLFQEDFFSSEKVHNALEPGIILASSSRLEKMRRRAETLGSLVLEGKHGQISADLKPEVPFQTPNATEDILEQAGHSSQTIESNQSAPSVSAPPSPLSSPKRKKKKKSSMDQMELF
jgi:hypothetical protein